MLLKIKKTSLIEKHPLVQVRVCCEMMDEALDGKFIQWEIDEENLYPVIFYVLVTNKSPKGALWDPMRIKFCPFCGKEIKVEEY